MGRQFRAAFDIFASQFADWLHKHTVPLQNSLIKKSQTTGQFLLYLESNDRDTGHNTAEAP